jgi:hypothetical protein
MFQCCICAVDLVPVSLPMSCGEGFQLGMACADVPCIRRMHQPLGLGINKAAQVRDALKYVCLVACPFQVLMHDMWKYVVELASVCQR